MLTFILKRSKSCLFALLIPFTKTTGLSRETSDTKIGVILDAAQNRFAHYGLGKTTMNDIANDIGMSKAALYYYFPDKQQLFREVILREQEDFIQQMESLLSKKKKASLLFMDYVELRHQYFQKLINLR